MTRESLHEPSAAADSEESPPTVAGGPVPRSTVVRADDYTFLNPPLFPNDLGELGGYRVLRVLGSGGMGVVFEAEDPKLERRIALKVMRPELARGITRERFLQEARAAAKVEHDNIIPIFVIDEDGGIPFLAMPFLKGEPLEDRLKREHRLSLAEVLKIGREMAAGLFAAHSKGLVHRDVKPANVWLETAPESLSKTETRSSKFRVKILDFGLARGSGADQLNLTRDGTIVGTPAYMAPEQARGKTVDHRADLFSLGIVLYRMATGELPFKGADAVSQLLAVTSETPPHPATLNPDLPPELADLIVRLLEKEADRRPASAKDVQRVLMGLSKPSPRATSQLGHPISDNPWAGLEDVQTEIAVPRSSGTFRPTPRTRRRSNLGLFVGSGIAIAGIAAIAIAVGLVAAIPKKADPTTVERKEPEPAKPAPASVKPAVSLKSIPYQVIPLTPCRDPQQPIFSPDGRWVAIPGDPIRTFEVATKKSVMFSRGSVTKTAAARSVAFQMERNESLLAAYAEGEGDMFARFAFMFPLLQRPAANGPKYPRAVAVPADGRYTVLAGRDGFIVQWRAESPRPALTVSFDSGRSKELIQVRLSPDGKILAAVLAGNGSGIVVQLWDVEERNELYSIPFSNASTKAGVDVALARDVPYVAISAGTETEIWDYRKKDKVRTVPAAGWPTFLSDSRHLLVGSKDRLKIFDLPNAQLKKEFHIDPSISNGGSLSPDGKTVAVVGTDGVLRFYDLAAMK
jgi:serine/threonine protein kinase